jgi:hypothetical protein
MRAAGCQAGSPCPWGSGTVSTVDRALGQPQDGPVGEPPYGQLDLVGHGGVDAGVDDSAPCSPMITPLLSRGGGVAISA